MASQVGVETDDPRYYLLPTVHSELTLYGAKSRDGHGI